MARRYEDDEKERGGNKDGGGNSGGYGKGFEPNRPYEGYVIIVPKDDIVIPEEINNPVWNLAEFLVRAGNPDDIGLLDSQIQMVNKIILDGSRYTALELGDMITFVDKGFSAKNIRTSGESFDGKVYLITSIVVKKDGIIINNTEEVNQNSLNVPLELKDLYPNPFN